MSTSAKSASVPTKRASKFKRRGGPKINVGVSDQEFKRLVEHWHAAFFKKRGIDPATLSGAFARPYGRGAQ